jgi:hypothetical protein
MAEVVVVPGKTDSDNVRAPARVIAVPRVHTDVEGRPSGRPLWHRQVGCSSPATGDASCHRVDVSKAQRRGVVTPRRRSRIRNTALPVARKGSHTTITPSKVPSQLACRQSGPRTGAHLERGNKLWKAG